MHHTCGHGTHCRGITSPSKHTAHLTLLHNLPRMLHDGGREPEALRNFQGVGLPRLAPQQAEGGAQRGHIKLDARIQVAGISCLQAQLPWAQCTSGVPSWL